jgi:hypothetical protein
MNVDRILQTLNSHRVAYLLIGGVNFLLRHAPVLTYDIDLWVEDTSENLRRVEKALSELQAEWGQTDHDWGPVAGKSQGWLSGQGVFCLTSPDGAIDIFRSVKGLHSWAECRARAIADSTPAGTPFVGLSDQDMLKSQMALPEKERDPRRVGALEEALRPTEDQHHDG